VNVQDRDHVSAAWIARQVGVGRAAVANWRKRYPDFPPPVAGGPNTPLFSWAAVEQWLVDTGKADQLAAVGRTVTGTQRLADASPPVGDPDRDLMALKPPELLARVLVSLLPRLGDGDPPDDDVEAPVVLDPACSDPLVLRAVAERFGDHVMLAGQAPNKVDAGTLRRELPGLGADVRVGDALRVDRFPEFRAAARAVLCVPPLAVRQWPAEELAADRRWRYGLPDPGDPELAWVQHCLAHLRPRGVAVVVMSPVTGVRPSGRHIRAALVRAGVLRDVIALPERLTPSGAGEVHLWVLERGRVARGVRMVNLTALADVADVPYAHAAWEALFAVDDPSVVRVVPELELLDGDAMLVPSRYLRPRIGDSAAELGRFTRRLAGLYANLGRVLPQSVAPLAQPRHPEVTLAELERSRAITILPRDATPRAGDLLFRTMGKAPVVAAGTPEDERGVAQVVGIDTDRLDPHFVAQFVRADALAVPVANTHAALTRDDVRRCRIPRLPLTEQRRYGDAFRQLQELDDLSSRLAGVTAAIVAQTVHGLTTGALSPSAVQLRDDITPASDENEKGK
jgi:hypothetical protein